MSIPPRPNRSGGSHSGGDRPPRKGGRPPRKGGAFQGDPKAFRGKFKKPGSGHSRPSFDKPSGEGRSFDRKPSDRKPFDRKGPPRRDFQDRPRFDKPSGEGRSFDRKPFDRKGPPRGDHFNNRSKFERKGPPRGDRPFERKPFDRKGPPRREGFGSQGGNRPPVRKGALSTEERSERREGVAPARWNAALALIRIEKGMKIQEAIALGAKLEGPDQALYTELVYGVTRMRRLLDKRLALFCERPLEETEPEVRTVLRLGLYQSLFLTRIPEYALTSEAVNQVRLLGAPFAMGFVNAVLRRANDAKNKGALPGPEEAEWLLGERTSHPDWLVERWGQRMSPERLAAVLDADNRPRPVYLQVPTERRDEAVERLDKAGVKVEKVDFPAHTLRVSGALGPMLDGEGLSEGPWVVQDWTFQLFLDLVPHPEGARVWDVCAAPGGKTAGMAWRVGPSGQVTATDASSERVKLLRSTMGRLGLSNVRVLEMEADRFPAAERFQSVWVDAPCSGTGVLSRRADLRWRLNPADLTRQSKRQYEILEAAAAHVYPGGFLAYSTCSLEMEENQEVAERFKKAHPEFEAVPLTLPPFVTEVEAGEHGLLVYPTADRDGGFLALLRRRL